MVLNEPKQSQAEGRVGAWAKARRKGLLNGVNVNDTGLTFVQKSVSKDRYAYAWRRRRRVDLPESFAGGAKHPYS